MCMHQHHNNLPADLSITILLLKALSYMPVNSKPNRNPHWVYYAIYFLLDCESHWLPSKRSIDNPKNPLPMFHLRSWKVRCNACSHHWYRNTYTTYRNRCSLISLETCTSVSRMEIEAFLNIPMTSNIEWRQESGFWCICTNKQSWVPCSTWLVRCHTLKALTLNPPLPAVTQPASPSPVLHWNGWRSCCVNKIGCQWWLIVWGCSPMLWEEINSPKIQPFTYHKKIWLLSDMKVKQPCSGHSGRIYLIMICFHKYGNF